MREHYGCGMSGGPLRVVRSEVIDMNRILRTVLSSTAVLGGLVGAPAIARAQVVNVAPPAYPVAPIPGTVADEPYPNVNQPGAAYGGSVYAPVFEGPYGRGVSPYSRRAWARHEWREHMRHAALEHERECARAYYGGASPWVLQRMQCRTY